MFINKSKKANKLTPKAQVPYISELTQLHSVAPEGWASNYKAMISNILPTYSLGICSEIVLMWMPPNLTKEKTTLAHAMVWCRQATSLYLNQCRARFMSTYAMASISHNEILTNVEILCSKFPKSVILSNTLLNDGNSLVARSTGLW